MRNRKGCDNGESLYMVVFPIGGALGGIGVRRLFKPVQQLKKETRAECCLGENAAATTIRTKIHNRPVKLRQKARKAIEITKCRSS